MAKRQSTAKPITPESLAASGTEDGNQMAVFQWCATTRLQGHYPETRLLFAIPLGGKRHIVTAMRMRATGSKRGVPDMMLPVPRRQYHGLFIELKKNAEQVTSPDQDRWIADLLEQGYCVARANGWQEAVNIIVRYLTNG